MAFIDEQFYKDYTSEPSTPDGFLMLADIASLQIDMLCTYQIGTDLTVLDSGTQDAIKKATAIQVKYLDEIGGINTLVQGESDVQSASIGKFSYSQSSGDATELIKGVKLSPLAEILLSHTGLLYRGVAICE